MNYEAIAEYSQIASAVLFVAAMVWIWIRFIQPAVLAAQENANAQVALAERHRDEAKSVLDSLQGEIAAAQRDAQSIRERCAVQAQMERDTALREARESGERAVRNAEGELQRARDAARVKLRDELLEQALTLARAQAAERIDGRTNAQLINRFLEAVGSDSQGRSVVHG